MNEQTKASWRRRADPDFLERFFVGRGLDLGPGKDGLVHNKVFPLIESVDEMDLEDGDAQELTWTGGRAVADGEYDFVHASHALEHLRDPEATLFRWIDAVRSGGHVIITVPDEDLYEQGHWPSKFSGEHLWSFTICKSRSEMPKSMNVLDLAKLVCRRASLERVILLRQHWRPDIDTDQTMGPAECAIEFVLRRL